MLRFANKPDPIFTAILEEALEDALEWSRDLASEKEWQQEHPGLARCFTRAQTVRVIDTLLTASRDPALYQLTDYHWLIIYECLRDFCDLHNDLVAEEPQGVSPVGRYHIGPIDFSAILDHYFWDTDFLFDADAVAAMGPEGRQMMGMSDEAFGISQDLPPHPEELKITHWKGPGWEDNGEELEPQASRIPQYLPRDEE